MNRFVLLFLAMSTTVLAEDPFACVDPEFIDAFSGGWSRHSPMNSTSAPNNFPDLSVPDSFTLVGSQVADSYSSVVYKTEIGVKAALSSASKTMTGAGWTQMNERGMSGGRGFQTMSRPKTAAFCRGDNSQALTASAHSRSGQTYVSFRLYGQSQSQGCGKFGLDARALVGAYETLRGHLPDLMLPEDAELSKTSGGSSGDSVDSRVDVLTSMSREGLLSFLGDQIQNQKWAFDTNWSGGLSSGSLWTLDTPDDGKMIGTLQILGPSVGAVRVRFSVFPAEPKIGGPQSNMIIRP